MGDEIKGIEGRKDEFFLIAFTFDGHWQQTMFQGDSGSAGLAEWQRVFLGGNGVQPWDIQLLSEFAEIAFLIHDRRIQQVINRRSLAQSRSFQ